MISPTNSVENATLSIISDESWNWTLLRSMLLHDMVERIRATKPPGLRSNKADMCIQGELIQDSLLHPIIFYHIADTCYAKDMDQQKYTWKLMVPESI